MEMLVLSVQQQYLQQEETPNQDPMNCRSAESRVSILHSPFVFSSGSSATNATRNGKRRSQHGYAPKREITGTPICGRTKTSRQSSPIPVQSKIRHKSEALSLAVRETEVFSSSSSSELWAGPTYSNSPPPSSLPMPRFSLREKRSISLGLPFPDSEFLDMHLVKSAPASPSKESPVSGTDFFLDIASATEDLRHQVVASLFPFFPTFLKGKSGKESAAFK